MLVSAGSLIASLSIRRVVRLGAAALLIGAMLPAPAAAQEDTVVVVRTDTLAARRQVCIPEISDNSRTGVPGNQLTLTKLDVSWLCTSGLAPDDLTM